MLVILARHPVFLADAGPGCEGKELPGLGQSPTTVRLGIKNHHRDRYEIGAAREINYNGFNIRTKKKNPFFFPLEKEANSLFSRQKALLLSFPHNLKEISPAPESSRNALAGENTAVPFARESSRAGVSV